MKASFKRARGGHGDSVPVASEVVVQCLGDHVAQLSERVRPPIAHNGRHQPGRGLVRLQVTGGGQVTGDHLQPLTGVYQQVPTAGFQHYFGILPHYGVFLQQP
ncbi:hypothetical protein TYRP_001872 [Tyrophagus putrescentiae]|nr:hypothetical protein TYRP_001872 [Tyrophagus putrescentiae]